MVLLSHFLEGQDQTDPFIPTLYYSLTRGYILHAVILSVKKIMILCVRTGVSGEGLYLTDIHLHQ